MKREELIELNVPEEAIDKIMQINGADIEKAKAALEEKEKELTEAHENLEAANKQIEEFKGMDIESTKKHVMTGSKKQSKPKLISKSLSTKAKLRDM